MCDYILKILLLGNPTKETRANVKRWLNHYFAADHKKTIGVELYSKTLIFKDNNVKLLVWEMFSEHEVFSEYGIFTNLRPRYFEGSLGALYIIDDATTASFQDFDEWLPIIQYSVGNSLEGYAILLVRNINIEEERNQDENMIAEKSQWFNDCLKCNFATGEHVEKVFQEITKLIMENFQRETPFGLRLKAGHYIIKKKFNKAIKCYKRALALNPNYELVKKELVELERQKKRKIRI